MRRITFELSDKLYKAFFKKCIDEDITMSNRLRQWIDAWVNYERIIDEEETV